VLVYIIYNNININTKIKYKRFFEMKRGKDDIERWSGERLKEIRTSANITMLDLSKITKAYDVELEKGLHHQTIFKLEHGLQDPTARSLILLKRALGIKDWLV
jgi:hypothetical protein